MSILQSAPTAYTFDDFYLAPTHSEVLSRKHPEVSTRLKNINLSIPIISSPMNTVTESAMAVTMAKMGGFGVIHRYQRTIKEQANIALNTFGALSSIRGFPAPKKNPYFACAIGANGDSMKRLDALWDEGVRAFCIDVANGHSVNCIRAIKQVKDKYPDAFLMAGNVCTYDGAYRLAEAGADAIRVGIGPGSMCTTRIVTGHGVPQLSAIEDCAKIKSPQPGENYLPTAGFPNISIIADGGIKNSGDMIKALAIGADAVMLGSLLAGTSDTPGETHQHEGKLYKYYHGMASEKGRASYFDREKTSYVPEGESTRVPYKGSTDKIVDQLVSSLRVGMSYSGAMSLSELRKRAKWVRVTGAGAFEGTPHGK